jgi:hypothetical protein
MELSPNCRVMLGENWVGGGAKGRSSDVRRNFSRCDKNAILWKNPLLGRVERAFILEMADLRPGWIAFCRCFKRIFSGSILTKSYLITPELPPSGAATTKYLFQSKEYLPRYQQGVRPANWESHVSPLQPCWSTPIPTSPAGNPAMVT